MKLRQYSTLDRGIMALDWILTNRVTSSPAHDQRPYPAEAWPQETLDEWDRRHVCGLMRVNYAGEVAAQALYKAQTLTARSGELKDTMQRAADEEIDHLNWCKQRLQELDGHTSHLDPVWCLGSFAIGIFAGCLGDKWNLGFLAETEYQVVKHLDSHLAKLPKQDQRSRAILQQMRADELHHATTAETAGAKILPKAVRCLMSLASKVMIKTAYRL